MEHIELVAYFKPVASAVRLDGEGDGGEMVLTFDRSQVANAVAAWAQYSGKAFVLTFADDDRAQC